MQLPLADLQVNGGNLGQAARLARRNCTDFYNLLARHRLTPEEFKQVRGPCRPMTGRQRRPDITKARVQVGWQPTMLLAEDFRRPSITSGASCESIQSALASFVLDNPPLPTPSSRQR
jgi:hypothetical protein